MKSIEELKNTVHLGDCLEVMKDIPDKSIDMILCDLPFGITAIEWDKLLDFNRLWAEYLRITKNNAAICLFASQPFTTKLISSNIDIFRYEYIWVKNVKSNFILAKKQPLKQHENICVFYKEFPTYNPQFQETESELSKSHAKKGYINSLSRKNNHFKNTEGITRQWNTNVYPSTVLKFNAVHNRSKERCHPTQKPVDLCEFLIRTYTNEGDLILDNCAGSGTIGLAARNLNRNYILIEKEPKYYDIILERLNAPIIK